MQTGCYPVVVTAQVVTSSETGLRPSPQSIKRVEDVGVGGVYYNI